MSQRMRLDKFLSLFGLGTRSELRNLVRAGRVTVDGTPERDAGRIIAPRQAVVTLDGQPLYYRAHRYVMLHKPAGVITAAEDPRLPTVMTLLPPLYAASGCMPVGRLDRDTEGLLLLTDDGELAHRLLSPKRGVDKRYYAEVDGVLSAADVTAFAEGLALSDFTALPAVLELRGEHSAVVTVQEGKFHQVKRMFAAQGQTVTYLKRLSFGPLALDETLPAGGHRELTAAETNALYDAVQLEVPADA